MKSYGTPRRGNARVAARTAILKEAEREAILAERARIVALVRRAAQYREAMATASGTAIGELADAIERGEHEEPKP
jgi:hypothetical protein